MGVGLCLVSRAITLMVGVDLSSSARFRRRGMHGWRGVSGVDDVDRVE